MPPTLEEITRDIQEGATTRDKRTLLSLAVCVALCLVAVEGLSRLLHDRRTVTLQIERGVADALGIRIEAAHQQVLVAGNSLVYEGISRSALQQTMGAAYKVHTAGVPGSTYFDWRYGLRALFERGSQPQVTVFAISPSQFLRPPAVTPLPVFQLWRLRDIFAYYRSEQPGLTTASDLLLEHYSTFFYMRDTFRIYVRKVIPGYERMIDQWNQPLPGQLAQASASERGTANVLHLRLLDLERECAHRSRLILLIVPTNQQVDELDEKSLRREAERLDIPLIEPVREREWPVVMFEQDHYHLTPEAATKFSSLAGVDLAAILGDRRTVSRGNY